MSVSICALPVSTILVTSLPWQPELGQPVYLFPVASQFAKVWTLHSFHGIRGEREREGVDVLLGNRSLPHLVEK